LVSIKGQIEGEEGGSLLRKVQIKRIYDAVEEADGKRVLVDRLWPRGVSKEAASLDEWLKEIGPSHELRKWFRHDAEKFATFREKYIEELSSGEQQEALHTLKKLAMSKVTLLTAAKETTYNHVQILKELLET